MNNEKNYSRFDIFQRVEHWVLVLSFTALAVTGLPQKFADAGWAQTLIGLLGGIELTRTFHHTAAIILLLETIYHGANLAYRVFVKRVRWSMFPQLQDAWDGLNTLLYNLGLRKNAPKMEHFTFAEKVEYWALIWGTIIMAITGFMLWNPITTSRFVRGEFIPAAKAAHGGEAILAVLAIVTWHFYNVHLRTLNKAMFTGKLPAREMEEEHTLELERVEHGQAERVPAPSVVHARRQVFIPIALVVSFILLFGVYLFTTAETTAVTTVPPETTIQVFVPQTPTPTRPLPTVAPTLSPQTTPGATQPASGVANALPADHTGRTTCLVCHTTGVGGAPQPPADHAGRDDTTCANCHELTSTAPQSTPATVSAIALPADHAGRTVCLVCHTNGLGGAPQVPADHSGRLDASCADCHKPK